MKKINSIAAKTSTVIQAPSSPAHAGLGVGPIKRWQHSLLFVVVFTCWFFAGRRERTRKPAVAAGAGRGPAKIHPEIAHVQENALAEESCGELGVPGCHAPAQTGMVPGFSSATEV